jgi:hypothetical protein
LVAAAALLFGIARAGLEGEDVAIEARREAWARRSARRSPRPLDLAELSPAPSAVRHEVVRPVGGLPAILNHQVSAHAVHVAPAGAWDRQDVPLSDRPQWHPHLGLLGPIVHSSLVPAAPDLGGGLGAWVERADAASREVRRQRGDAERKAGELRRDIGRLREEIRILDEKRREAERLEDRRGRAEVLAEIDTALAARRRELAIREAALAEMERVLRTVPD